MDSKNEYTLEEISENNGEEGRKLWVLIDGKVYDVTKYKHPGGREIFEDPIGEDRIDEFTAIGHSPAAKQEMTKYHIGFLKAEPKKEVKKQAVTKKNDEKEEDTATKGTSPMVIIAPVMVVLLVLIVAYNLLLKN